jgi:hypothetical protein
VSALSARSSLSLVGGEGSLLPWSSWSRAEEGNIHSLLPWTSGPSDSFTGEGGLFPVLS